MNKNYINSSFNQLSNSANPFQNTHPKALCVCSAGLLRSPTIAKYLSNKNYNTRACGTSLEYALIPISKALLYWADEIHVVKEQAGLVKSIVEELDLHSIIHVYDIPDTYQTFDPDLFSLIDFEYRKNHNVDLV